MTEPNLFVQLNLTIGPLALFACVAAITPGPNNLLLMRSGARFGVRRSAPHMVGIQIGMIGLVLLSRLGVGAVLLAAPFAMTVLHWASFAYLLWLAAIILRDAAAGARSAADGSLATSAAAPMTVLQAMSFQLINPKAWMMAVTVVSAFYGGAAPTSLDLAVATLICTCIGSASMLIWNIWGAAIDRVLEQPRARQAFGYCMGMLVLATALWLLR